MASPDHPLARRRRIPLTALANETFLVREPGSGTRSAMQEFFVDQRAKWQGDFPTIIQCQIESDRDRIDDILLSGEPLMLPDDVLNYFFQHRYPPHRRLR